MSPPDLVQLVRTKKNLCWFVTKMVSGRGLSRGSGLGRSFGVHCFASLPDTVYFLPRKFWKAFFPEKDVENEVGIFFHLKR
jgi:hypothetical protein